LLQRRDIAGDFGHGLEDERFLRVRIGPLGAPLRTVFGEFSAGVRDAV
jgi:hypothetical protein